MTTSNNGHEVFPLRPLFRKFAHEAPSPVDKLRRIILPAQLPSRHKPTAYSSRIEKHHTSPRKQHVRASLDLDQQFSESIDDTRQEIRKSVDAVLVDIEGDANAELAHAAEEFEEKLQLALDYETRAFQSIADERLLVTKLSFEKKVVTKEEVIFADRMEVFQQILEEKEKTLESLWQEWTKVQTEMVYLAFEVLGPDEVTIEEAEMSSITPEKVDGAIQCYMKHQDSFRDGLNRLDALQNLVKQATFRTLKTLKDQQEELSAANRATMKNMAKMLEDLNP